MEKHKSDLLKFDGVRGVSIDYPVKNGEVDMNTIALVVFVVRKFDSNKLQEQQLPLKEIEGVPVDVIESNLEEHSEQPEDSLLGGVRISNMNLSGKGTLGAVVIDNFSGRFLGLSNWHVLKRKRGSTVMPQTCQIMLFT